MTVFHSSCGRMIFHCAYRAHFLYPFIWQGTLCLTPNLSYCKECWGYPVSSIRWLELLSHILISIEKLSYPFSITVYLFTFQSAIYRTSHFSASSSALTGFSFLVKPFRQNGNSQQFWFTVPWQLKWWTFSRMIFDHLYMTRSGSEWIRVAPHCHWALPRIVPKVSFFRMNLTYSLWRNPLFKALLLSVMGAGRGRK